MPRGQTIVLVHGLWMHGLAMRVMQMRFERWGYTVCAYSYSSVRCDLQENARRLARYIDSIEGDTVHVVAHSMGGLVAFAAAALVPPRGKLVFLGTPFAGSYSGRRLERSRFGRWLLGRCMLECMAAPARVKPPGLEIGVVAGSGGIGMGRLVAPGLPRPHDGVVGVDETCVPGMRDRVVLGISHTAMLVGPAVARQVRAFLEHGRFERT